METRRIRSFKQLSLLALVALAVLGGTGRASAAPLPHTVQVARAIPSRHSNPGRTYPTAPAHGKAHHRHGFGGATRTLRRGRRPSDRLGPALGGVSLDTSPQMGFQPLCLANLATPSEHMMNPVSGRGPPQVTRYQRLACPPHSFGPTFPLSQLDTFSLSQLDAFPPSQFDTFSLSQIDAFPPSQFDTFSLSQIDAFPPSQPDSPIPFPSRAGDPAPAPTTVRGQAARVHLPSIGESP
jgi:hypothetical protein